MKKRLTQRDVARLAGVSQATVSIVLTGSGTPPISADTWRRITDAARELGYIAQPLRAGAAHQPEHDHRLPRARHHQPVLPGADPRGSVGCRRHELRPHHHQHRRPGGARAPFPRLGAAGAGRRRRSASSSPCGRRTSSRWSTAAYRWCASNRSKKRGGEIAIDDIYVDSHAAAFAVTRFLIERGHRRIAMIAGRGGPQSVRVEGYRQALVEAGGTPHIVIDDEFSETGGMRATEACSPTATGRPRSLPPTT